MQSKLDTKSEINITDILTRTKQNKNWHRINTI